MKFKLITLPLITLGLVACQPLKGPLQVTQPFDITTKDKKTVQVPIGTFDTDFKYDDGKREVEIKIKKLNGKDQTMKFKVPPSVNIPTTGGTFRLEGRDINQDFDLGGRVSYQVTDSETRRDRESCTYTVSERVCETRRVCPDQIPGRPRRPCRNENYCYYVDRTIYGQREIEYYVKTTYRGLDAQFSSPRTNRSLARLSADKTTNEAIRTYVGRCY
ncbi:MAG: hypothetical protein K2X47_04145 [Bdellovibrionales bacterium]|nr:hypothetical protein [Bdellovibrionales bacterium]